MASVFHFSTAMARLPGLIALTFLLTTYTSLAAGAPQNVAPDIQSACLGAHPEDILLERSKWYSYEASIVGSTKAAGASDQDAGLDIKCSLKVRHSTDCAYTLEFEKCALKASKGNQNNRKTFLDEPNWSVFGEHPIAFTVNGGEVRTVLAHPNDPLSFVNLKRGFISAIIIGNQPTNSSQTFKELRDVQGTCSLRLIPSPAENKVFAEKKLSECTLPERPQVQLSPFSVFWDMNFLKFLVKSTLSCESDMTGNQKQLQKLTCTEEHTGRVDSSQNTEFGLKTLINYELKLEDTGSTNPGSGLQVDQLRQTGIEYEYEEPSENFDEDSSAARELLETLLDETEIDLETIPKFLTLVERMRHVSDLSELTQEVEACPVGENDCARKRRGIPLYLDALVHCNRLPCVKTLKELHARKLVSKTFLEFALFSWLRMPLTDHRYFNEFLEMCRTSQTRFCWLGLGGLVRTYSRSHEEIPDSLRQVVNLVSQIIGQSCSISEVTFPRGTITDQKPNYIVTMLKTLGNMGKVILEVDPNLHSKILNCAKNSGLSKSPRIAALQTLVHLGQPLPQPILDEVSSILLNDSLPADYRVAAYDAVINLQDDNQELAAKLATLLKDDPSKQVKAYIASDITENQRRGSNNFWTAFDEELVRNQVDLYALDAHEPDTSSHVSLTQQFFRLPRGVLPEELSRFGHSVLSAVVFGGHSVIPQSIITKLNLTLFGQMLEFMEVGLQTAGLDGLFIRSSSSLSGIQSSGNANYMQYLALIMQQLSPSRSASRKAKSTTVLLNQKWEENLDRLYQTYQENHPQFVKPHVMLYLRMLGLDLDFTTFPDIVGVLQRSMQGMNQRQRTAKDSRENIPFSETHLINFLEAVHSFPTLMGIPMNWRTNFTLAASLDMNTNFDMKLMKAEFRLKPRLATTMLNQMMLEIPGVTQLGIHSKNSLFSATEFDFRIEAVGQKISVTMLPPKTKQRPFELYRNNYLVSGEEVTELDDWDAERINHEECLGEKFVKATGMNVCMKSSYLDVSDRKDKPFYLLAGKASWALSAEMEDKGIYAYTVNVEVKEPTKDKVDVEITGDAKGTVWSRDIPLKISFNKATEEFELGVTHSDFPDFNFTVSRNRIFEDNEYIGYKSFILVRDEGKTWDLSYTKSKKKEVRQDRPSKDKERSVEAHVEERSIVLKTPYNDYVSRLKLHRQSHSGNLKVDFLLSYLNMDRGNNWLQRILPKIFWESNSKAWLEFRGDWRFGQPGKGGHHKDHHNLQHESKSHLSIPATVIQVISHHVNKPKHTMHRFNVSKVERSTGQLLLFANMSYNVWRKGKDGEAVNEIRTANLTMARHSWNLETHRQGNLQPGKDGEEVLRYVLTGEKMIPINPADRNYIGWWNPKSASRFYPKRWEVVYDQHLKQKQVSENDLPPDSQKEVQDDISSEEDDGHSSEEELLSLAKPGIRNQAIHADVSLSYPFGERQENLTFKGMFQWNGRASPAYRTFLKTFTLGSTLHSLQLDSQSLYTKAGNEKVVLSHHSVFTDPQTQANHGVYDLQYRKQLQPDSCTSVLLNHTVSAHWLNFASHVIGTCKPGKPKARLYDIKIHADHPYWKELDFDLTQTFDLDLPGGERMDLKSSTLDITVTGNWTPTNYHKKVQFDSKTDVMPTTTWEINSDKKGEMVFTINAPNEYIDEVKVHRQLHKTKDKVDYNVLLKHENEPELVGKLHLTAKIINSHSILVNGSWDPLGFVEVGSWLGTFLGKSVERIVSKLADPNHQFNQHMKTHLNGQTILQYLAGLQMRFCQNAGLVWRDTFEIIETFKSFYKPSFEIVANTAREIGQVAHEKIHALASSRLGWAWNHFEVSRYIVGIRPEYALPHGPNMLMEFSYVLHHPSYTWSNFAEWPKANREDSAGFFHGFYEKDTPLALPPLKDGEHVAMIYGPNHGLSFDGQYLLFPGYQSDSCAVLLAQDVRGRTFSVTSNKENIFLIFPDMAVTIHESGRIYVNTSKLETSTPISSYSRKVQVSRIADIIRVESSYLRVDCDTSNEFCVFVLNPLLSGGVIGLLGNADGEPHNDFVSPEGRKVSSMSGMAALYEVSGDSNCASAKEQPEVPSEDGQTKRRCDRLFKQPEMAHCLADAGIKEADLRPSCVIDFQREGCPCATSKALTGFCAYRGYSLDRCKFQRRPEGSTPVPNQHDSWLVKGSHQLQVVVIVEAHKSVLRGKNNQALKGLETLLENLEETFTSEGGFLSPTYSLVVYSGDDNPQVYTQHRSSWMVHRDFMKSVREIDFHSSKRGDPIAAVEFAASMLSFEASATKLMLLITLDDNVQASSSSHVHDVLQLLDHNGAPLYVLASYPSLERGKKVFGLRADGLIFPNIGGEAYGNFPRSPSAKLAAGTRGSIFWRNHLEENKNPLFYESLSGEMLARVQKERGKCRQCTCAMSPWWQMQNYCKPAPSHLQRC